MKRSALLLLGLLAAGAMAAPPGRVLDAPPPIPPGGVVHAPAPALATAVTALDAGDRRRALLELEAWLGSGAGPWGRERVAGRFLLGWLYMQDGHDNLASAQFTAVRTSGTPLAEDAAWYEAVVDLRRDRPTVAARECEAYREAWPEGAWRGECLLLAGRAYTQAGLRSAALAAYTLYLEEHPDSPREEEVRLGMILAEASSNPQRAAVQLRDLALRHRYHANGVAAEDALAELIAERGVVLEPLDPLVEERLRAESLRDCGYSDEAWAHFQHLVEAHGDDAEVQQWAQATGERFAWRTRQYEAVADSLVTAYRKAPSGETAWLIFRAYSRAGEWARASDWAEVGLQEHSTDWRWRRTDEQLAHANLLAGRFVRARELWDGLARTGGSVGRQARWFAAYSSVRAQEWDDAVVRLSVLVEEGGDTALAARYHRARAYEALGQKDAARQDRAVITQGAPGSWYALLLRKGTVGPERLRDGRWPGPPPPDEPAALPLHPIGTPEAAPLRAATTGLPAPRALTWEALGWDPPAVDPPAVDPPDGAPAAPPVPPTPAPAPLAAPPDPYQALRHPDDYPAGRFYDPAAALKALRSFSEDWKLLWPRLPAAADLAGVGLYELAGPIVAQAYEEWDEAASRKTVRQAELRQAPISKGDWKPLLLAARDHHHVAKFLFGLERNGALTPAEQAEALRLTFPAPFLDTLIEHGRRFGVDPLLALGLMRQESVYNAQALSHAGAMGLMQVMPNTGAKVAAMLGETRYSPTQLEDPVHNLRYGTYYLSRLLVRFEGGWPLAVAAYNAGPVNVSSWYRPWRGRIRMDDFVEQIPLHETRNYVKRVSEYYNVYVTAWGPPGAEVRVPGAPGEDREEVINF